MTLYICYYRISVFESSEEFQPILLRIINESMQKRNAIGLQLCLCFMHIHYLRLVWILESLWERK